jgi:hypothetical protein
MRSRAPSLSVLVPLQVRSRIADADDVESPVTIHIRHRAPGAGHIPVVERLSYPSVSRRVGAIHVDAPPALPLARHDLVTAVAVEIPVEESRPAGGGRMPCLVLLGRDQALEVAGLFTRCSTSL